MVKLTKKRSALDVEGISTPSSPNVRPGIMDSKGPNVGGVCGTSKKKIKPKTLWDHDAFKKFIGLCLIELRKGNKPRAHFNKVGWANIEKNMCEKTGKVFKKKQLKNKWDIMKKDWKLYERLTSVETGIGGTGKLLDASPEWWDEKIKEDKDYAKFRDSNLKTYVLLYAPLFQGSVAVGDQTMTPFQFQNDSSPNDVKREENMEGKEDNDEINVGDDEPLFPSFPENSLSKRKKHNDIANIRSTKGKTSSFEEKLDAVSESDTLSSESTQTYPPNNPSPTILDCIKIVTSFPGFQEGTEMYSLAFTLFSGSPTILDCSVQLSPKILGSEPCSSCIFSEPGSGRPLGLRHSTGNRGRVVFSKNMDTGRVIAPLTFKSSGFSPLFVLISFPPTETSTKLSLNFLEVSWMHSCRFQLIL